MEEPIWYYAIAGQRHGPVTLTQLREVMAAGQLTPQDLVWRDGMANWQEAALTPELQAQINLAPPPPGAPLPYASPQMPQEAGFLNYGQQIDSGGKATTAMVLGICSLVLWFCPLTGLATGIPAWIMGAKYRTGPNGGQATAGMVMGIIGCGLSVLNSCLGILMRTGRW